MSLLVGMKAVFLGALWGKQSKTVIIIQRFTFMCTVVLKHAILFGTCFSRSVPFISCSVAFRK